MNISDNYYLDFIMLSYIFLLLRHLFLTLPLCVGYHRFSNWLHNFFTFLLSFFFFCYCWVNSLQYRCNKKINESRWISDEALENWPHLAPPQCRVRILQKFGVQVETKLTSPHPSILPFSRLNSSKEMDNNSHSNSV